MSKGREREMGVRKPPNVDPALHMHSHVSAGVSNTHEAQCCFEEVYVHTRFIKGLRFSEVVKLDQSPTAPKWQSCKRNLLLHRGDLSRCELLR